MNKNGCNSYMHHPVLDLNWQSTALKGKSVCLKRGYNIIILMHSVIKKPYSPEYLILSCFSWEAFKYSTVSGMTVTVYSTFMMHITVVLCSYLKKNNVEKFIYPCMPLWHSLVVPSGLLWPLAAVVETTVVVFHVPGLGLKMSWLIRYYNTADVCTHIYEAAPGANAVSPEYK